MRRVALVPALALIAACATDPGSQTLYSGYFLSTIDGQLLPAADRTAPAGSVVVTATLGFPPDDRPRSEDPALATYARIVRLPDGTEQLIRVELRYAVSRGTLRIDLCPPPVLCLVPAELRGSASRDELLLTHYLAGEPRSVYRFFAALPD